MSTDAVIPSMFATRVPLAQASPPCEAGIYAVFLAAPNPALPVANLELPIYVGRSSDLARRAMNQHLKPRASGASTLRRSLGAVLKQELGMTVRPRGRGKSKQDFTHYRFDDISESRLTDWMDEHLLIAFLATPQYVALEQEVVHGIQPPLNIDGCSGASVLELKALRARCADEARAVRGDVPNKRIQLTRTR